MFLYFICILVIFIINSGAFSVVFAVSSLVYVCGEGGGGHLLEKYRHIYIFGCISIGPHSCSLGFSVFRFFVEGTETNTLSWDAIPLSLR